MGFSGRHIWERGRPALDEGKACPGPCIKTGQALIRGPGVFGGSKVTGFRTCAGMTALGALVGCSELTLPMTTIPYSRMKTAISVLPPPHHSHAQIDAPDNGISSRQSQPRNGYSRENISTISALTHSVQSHYLADICGMRLSLHGWKEVVMDFIDQLQALATKIQRQRDHIVSE